MAIAAGHQLPLLATGGVWTSLNAIFNTTAAILLAGGVALILLALRPPRALFLWLSLALAAIAIGNALSVFGGGRSRPEPPDIEVRPVMPQQRCDDPLRDPSAGWICPPPRH